MAKTRLLVKVRGNGSAFARQAASAFGAAATEVEPILERAGAAGRRRVRRLRRAGGDVAPGRHRRGRATTIPGTEAHAMLGGDSPFAIGGRSGIVAVEPDIKQEWPPYRAPAEAPPALAAAADICAYVDQDGGGGKAVRAGEMGWNFHDAFSELAKARARFGGDLGDKLGRIVIAHLDTGYDPAHVTRPARLRTDLQRNFVQRRGRARTTPRTSAARHDVRPQPRPRHGDAGAPRRQPARRHLAALERFRRLPRRRAARRRHPDPDRRLGRAVQRRHHGAGLRLCPPARRPCPVDEHGRRLLARAGRRHQPRLRRRHRPGRPPPATISPAGRCRAPSCFPPAIAASSPPAA